MRALELDAKMQAAQRNLEIAYFNTGYRQAHRRPHRAAAREARRSHARWELGRTHALLSQTAEAVAAFTELLSYSPTDIGALAARPAERTNGDLTRRSAISSARWPWIHRARWSTSTSGKCCTTRGVNEGGFAALRRAVELNPQNPDAAYLMALRAWRHGPASKRRSHARCASIRHAHARSRRTPAIDRSVERVSEPTPTRSARDTADGGARRRTARPVQPRPRIPAEGLLTAARCANTRRRWIAGRSSARAPGHGRGAPALRREPKLAVALYDELLANAPISPKLWNERGVALHQDGNFAEAEGEPPARGAVGADVRTGATTTLASPSIMRRAPDAAIESFARRLMPADVYQGAAQPALLLSKGGSGSSSRSRRIAAYCSRYRKTLRRGTASASCSRSSRFEDARNAFARAVQSNPDSAEAHYNLSFTLSNIGDFEGARNEARAELVPVRAEVRVGDRPGVRGSGSLDRRISARSSARTTASRTCVRFGGARFAVHRARAADTACLTQAGAGVADRARSVRDGGGLSRHGTWRRAAAEVSVRCRAVRRRRKATRCSATSMRDRVSTVRRSSGSAKRDARCLTRCGRRSARRGRCWRWGARAKRGRSPSNSWSRTRRRWTR